MDEIALCVLQNVTKIAGSLQIYSNSYLTTLSFFSNLQSVSNVLIGNNPNLIDARMPNLSPPTLLNVQNFLVFYNNPRVCPLWSVNAASKPILLANSSSSAISPLASSQSSLLSGSSISNGHEAQCVLLNINFAIYVNVTFTAQISLAVKTAVSMLLNVSLSQVLDVDATSWVFGIALYQITGVLPGQGLRSKLSQALSSLHLLSICQNIDASCAFTVNNSTIPYYTADSAGYNDQLTLTGKFMRHILF